MTQPRLSACLITFNEERNVLDCLESIKWADEIVVVDSYSADRTVELAARYTERVLQREWRGINEQRQFCLEQATGDWVLCVDADERVTPRLRDEIQGLLKSGPSCAAYAIPRKTFYLGRWIRHCGWYPGYKVRLFRRDAGRFGDNDPHDKVLIDGAVGKLRSDLEHYTYRDLVHHASTVNSFSTTAAERLHRLGKRGSLWAMAFKPPWRFVWQYVLRGGFLDGGPGLIICIMSAYSVFLRSAKLWELSRADRRSTPAS